LEVYKIPSKKNKRKKNGFTFPAALWAGVTGQFVMPVPPYGDSILNSVLDGDYETALKKYYHTFTGVNDMGVFSFQNLVSNYKPLIAGLGVHWLASKSGANRMIAQAGIPVLRI
jgi:hypothetical protein